ncbi:carbon monoxide dehydrogenase [Kyrpidia spormannii]|uniref:Carbon monoxide dehydrogenase n=1 Tax=Kyrpidia spormannii TaxID=2055160 RepID=A0A2K8N8Z6_9BACL|nr:carbon monoxide dehydrogenase subunit G [Kyrpidia spormannii]ATY85763.1 carbon monoxide dehydrogenase [Kyrpidia spormannii]
MRVEYRYTYETTPEELWPILNDPDVLKRRLPGCKRLEEVGEGKYTSELGLDVGPVKGTFTGEVEVLDPDPPKEYKLHLKGSGKPGEIDAVAQIRLEEQEGKTVLTCSADAHVTGIMASVGQRIMGGVAKLLLGQFFKGVEQEMKRAKS